MLNLFQHLFDEIPKQVRNDKEKTIKINNLSSKYVQKKVPLNVHFVKQIMHCFSKYKFL